MELSQALYIALITQAPGTEAPGTEAPGTEAPGTEAPGTDTDSTVMPVPTILFPHKKALRTQRDVTW